MQNLIIVVHSSYQIEDATHNSRKNTKSNKHFFNHVTLLLEKLSLDVRYSHLQTTTHHPAQSPLTTVTKIKRTQTFWGENEHCKGQRTYKMLIKK